MKTERIHHGCRLRQLSRSRRQVFDLELHSPGLHLNLRLHVTSVALRFSKLSVLILVNL